MLIIEWLMLLPRSDGFTVARKTVTNVDKSADATNLAGRLWATMRSRNGRRVDGFQVVDQDGRQLVSPRFPERDDWAA